VVSKPQIRFKGKAQADRESAAYVGMGAFIGGCAVPYSIKSGANPACGATQPLGRRWGFETTSDSLLVNNPPRCHETTQI